MKSRLIAFFLLLLGALESSSQTSVAIPPTAIRASVREGNRQLIIEIVPRSPVSPGLGRLLSDKANYRIYKIEVDDPAAPRSRLLDFSALTSGDPVVCDNSTGVCLIELLTELAPGSYLIEVQGLRSVAGLPSDTVPVFYGLKPPPAITPPGISTTPAAIVSSLDGRRNKVRVQAETPIVADPTLHVLNTTLNISSDGSRVNPSVDTITAKVEDPASPGNPIATRSSAKEFTLLLDDGLSKGKTHSLNIADGIFDPAGDKVKTKGSVEIPGLPKAPDALNFELKLSSEAANHQKPFFNLFAKYDAQDQLRIGNCVLSINLFPCYWHPQISIDVGLGETKSKNAIIIDLPFRSLIHHDNICLNYSDDQPCIDPDDRRFRDLSRGQVAIPTYYAWKNVPWYRGSVFLSIGPKFEADRRFARINTLGSVKLDFKLHRFLASIANKRSLLSGGPPYGLTKQQLSQVEIRSGFSIIPFLGFDFGRKVTTEVIEKGTARQVVPQHSIFRSFAGVKTVFEWELFTLPMSLSVEERLFHLAKQETIGSIVGSNIDLRRVRGFHHRGILSWDVFLNQVRRYSFNVTYENGRSAPNFEYLSKVSAGFRVVY